MPLSPWSKKNSYNRQQALMDVIENPFRVAVYREKNRYIDQVAEHTKTSLTADNDALFHDHLFKMTEIFRQYDHQIMVLMANEVGIMAKSGRPTLEYKYESRVETFFREWFMKFGAVRAQETAHTTRDDIRRALLVTHDEGTEENPQEPAFKRILRAKGLSPWRANTIARTETHNAAMSASIRTAEDIRDHTGVILLKEWVPVEDSRTRDAHAAMDGSAPIPVGQKFLVGGEYIDRPGEGSAANSINCRCVMVYSSD